MGTKAFLIARVSTKDQKDALPAQKYRLFDYAERQFTDFEYIEFQESAYRGDREIFTSITDKIFENNETAALVFDKIDRLTRDYTDPVLRTAISYVKKGRIELHFPSEGLVLNRYSSANELQRLGMGAVSSQNYSDSVSYNVRRRNEQLRRDGIWTNPAPFGYTNVTLANGKKWIDLVPIEAEAVRTAYELYATGNYSVKLVRKKIIEQYGITRTAAQWHKVLNNPFYSGIMRVKGELYPHHYIAAISEDLYEQVKAVMKGYAVQPKIWAGLPYPYRGLISCSVCGCRITFEQKKGGKYIYGHCTQYKGKHDAVYVQQKDMTKQLKTVFREVQLPEHARNEIVASLTAEDEVKSSESREKLTYVDAEISRYDERIQRNYDTYIDGGVAKEMYLQKDAELKASQKALRKTRKNLELVANNNFDWAVSLLDLSREAPEIFEGSENEDQRTLINKVLSNLELEGKELRWKLKWPFDMMAICNKTQNWLGICDEVRTILIAAGHYSHEYVGALNPDIHLN